MTGSSKFNYNKNSELSKRKSMKEIITVQALDDTVEHSIRKFEKSEIAYKYAYNLSVLYECDVCIMCYLDDKCWGKITIRNNKQVGVK